ncbi:hypothetical protein HDU78_008975 [Chytriomyces hyalinus]|nr:hypothetical protein HDU78_008975 [Chytriomyces hyalinus]
MNDTNVLDYLELPLSEDLYVLEEHRLGIAYVFLMDSAKDARFEALSHDTYYCTYMAMNCPSAECARLIQKELWKK